MPAYRYRLCSAKVNGHPCMENAVCEVEDYTVDRDGFVEAHEHWLCERHLEALQKDVLMREEREPTPDVRMLGKE